MDSPTPARPLGRRYPVPGGRPGQRHRQRTTPHAQQVAAIGDSIGAHRASPGAFDIVAGGPERGPDPGRTRELVRQSAQAGATWFSEWIPPADPATMHATIAQGPIRADAA